MSHAAGRELRDRAEQARMSVRAAAQTLTVKLISYAAGAGVSIWVARALGPHDRGIWSLCLLVTVILALLTDAGLGTAALYLLRNKIASARAVATSSLRLLLINGGLLATLTLLLTLTGGLPAAGLSTQVVTLAVLASLFAATTSLVRQLLTGLGDLVGANLSQLIQALILPLALLPVLVLASPTAVGALGAYVVALVVTAGVTLRRLAPRSLEDGLGKTALVRPLFSYGLRSQLATLVLILAYRSDLFMVNHYLGLVSAGVYSVALTLSEILRGVAETAQMLVVSRAAGEDLEARAQAIARRAAVVTALGAVAMAAASGILVPLVFGEAYRDAATAFWYLAPGVVGLALSYSLSPILFLEGKVLVNAVAALAALATLWLVGTLGPGAPSLAKFATASSMAYWVLAAIQIGVLRLLGRIRLTNLVPSGADAVAFSRGMRMFMKNPLQGVRYRGPGTALLRPGTERDASENGRET